MATPRRHISLFPTVPRQTTRATWAASSAPSPKTPRACWARGGCRRCAISANAAWRKPKPLNKPVTPPPSHLAENPHDFPFALIYLLGEDGRRARLCETVNLPAGTKASPETVIIGSGDDVWNFGRVIETSQSQIVEDLEERFGRLPAGPWTDDWTKRALVLPLAEAGSRNCPQAFLVAGISPRLAFDDDYRSFLDLVAGQIATAIANARAYEEERKRAEALAEIDRAKTAFFSNV